MKPGPRFVQLTSVAMLTIAALAACRKEVPSPTPSPDRDPKPTVQATAYAALHRVALRPVA